MRHYADRGYWGYYYALPAKVRETADKQFALLKANPRHPSLHLKPVGDYWSVRVGIGYRALAIKEGNDFIWFWIGPHGKYERLI